MPTVASTSPNLGVVGRPDEIAGQRKFNSDRQVERMYDRDCRDGQLLDPVAQGE